jgi:hypothetical protein
MIGWWLSTDNVPIENENYILDGESYGNGNINCYNPKNKNIRYINISTEYGIDWQIFEIKVYGRINEEEADGKAE